jgi:hypothetical protein
MSPDRKGVDRRDDWFGEASPLLKVRRLPGKEDKLSCITPLDPALQDWRSALRQHFVRREQAGKPAYRLLNTIRQDSLCLPPSLLKRVQRQFFFFITDLPHKNEIDRLHQEEHPYTHGPCES